AAGHQAGQGARPGVLRKEAPETVRVVALVQEIAVRREEPARARLKGLRVADLSEGLLGVRAAQEEVAIALHVGHRDSAAGQRFGALEKRADRRRLEVAPRDEEVERVAEQRDRARAAPPRLVERLEERPFVAGTPSHVAIGENGAHALNIAQPGISKAGT